MQAYFPRISQPEGLPIRIQDIKGKDWMFQFRFWPNNNSRMYVLEGVTPCIQSMQLQAGDTGTIKSSCTRILKILVFVQWHVSLPFFRHINVFLILFYTAVTFSRIDPEGKLLMGFRKTSSPVIMQVFILGHVSCFISAHSHHPLESQLSFLFAQRGY